ncbi:hypothetical protein ASE96_03255 [Arthrobacter sp. Leaf69]|nr:hypothetical protein ASE96_03255 [Arthrobacter sp. Leaf69]
MAIVVLLLGLFLAGTGSSMVQRWRISSARHESLGFEDQLGLVANTAGLIVTVWWAMSLVIAVTAALLERSGKVRAASATGKFAPGFMRRLALAAVGLQLLTAPLATASPAPSMSTASSLPVAASPAPSASAAWTRTPDPAATGAPPGAPAVAHPQWRPLPPVIEPGPLAGGPRRLQQPAGRGVEVTVRSGDSLWGLSAARLGPYASDVDIALDWPRIYRANRDVIGDNPHLLRPGQVLRVPPAP